MASLNYIFAGNPGVGKSTLLNSMLGRAFFKSGFSCGAGMTYQLDRATADGITYLDTPGLADMEMRKAAADAIEVALKQYGLYKILFIITLESGRVRPADVATIQCIHQACPVIARNYGVIINKLEPKMINRVDITKISACIFSGTVPATAFVHINPSDVDLVDEDDKFKTPPPELTRFLDMVPTINISPSDVNQIKVDNYGDEMEKLEEIISKLERENAARDEKMEAQKAEFLEQIQNIQQRADEARTFFQEQQTQDREDQAKQRDLDRQIAKEMQDQGQLARAADKEERLQLEARDREERREARQQDSQQMQQQMQQMQQQMEQMQATKESSGGGLLEHILRLL